MIVRFEAGGTKAGMERASIGLMEEEWEEEEEEEGEEETRTSMTTFSCPWF